jgi:hypothetical protein
MRRFLRFATGMNTRILVFLAPVLLAAPCARAGQFIDWLGGYSDSNSPWSVTVSENKPPSFGYKRAVSTAVSPQGWLPHKGWFVCIEDDSHLWAYDGQDQLLLLEIIKAGSILRGFDASKDFNSLPKAPPDDVLKRLPEGIRKKLMGKFATPSDR